MVGSLTLTVANAALVLFAWRAAPVWMPWDGPWTRALSATLVWTSAVLVLTGLAGMAGLLRPEFLLLGALVLAGAAVGFSPPPAPPPRRGPRRSGLELAVFAAAGASLGPWLAYPVVRGTRFVFDDITYHAALPVEWALQRGFAYSPLTYQSYYPFNAELPGLWGLVLSGDLGMAGLGPLLAASFVLFGAVALLEALELPTLPGLAASALLFASPPMRHFSMTFSANDLMVTGYVLAAVAFTVGRPDKRRAWAAGLALGAALGTKVSVAPQVLLVGAWWAFRAPRLLPRVAVGVVVLGSGWYLRNLIHTGNPLYPAALGPLAGPFDAEAQARTTLLRFIREEGHRLGWWWELVRHRLDWPVPVGLLGVFGSSLALVAGRRPERRGALLLALCGLLFLALFPLQPYSGTINRPFGTLHKMVRYLALPVVTGVVALPTIVRSERGARWLTGALLFGWAWVFGSSWAELDRLMRALASGGAAIGLGLGLLPPWRHRWVTVALLGVALFGTRPEVRSAGAWAHRIAFSPLARRHRGAWVWLDHLPPTSVAWIGDLPASHTFVLPLYGSALQHRVVPVDRSGALLREPLHRRWEGERWWAPFHARYDDGEVLERLLKGTASYLVLSNCQRDVGGPWPAPRAALLARGRAQRRYADRCVEVWALEPLRTPGGAAP